MPGTVPPSVAEAHPQPASRCPPSFSDAEKAAFAGLEYFYRKGFGYAEMMNTRPQTLGYALADSPVGMLAFFYDKFTEWTYSGGEPEKVAHARRDARRRHAVLAHEHRHVLLAAPTGTPRRAEAGPSTPSTSRKFRSP